MSQPYVGEIRLVGFNFEPNGWAYCNGQLLSIAENETLFNLIGTTYGGDGQSTFAVPDLRGRAAIHQGGSVVIGEMLGREAVTLTTSQIPPHTHEWRAKTTVGTSSSPVGGELANAPAGVGSSFGTGHNVSLDSSAVGNSGGSQPHSNMQPLLGMNYIISLFGIYPSGS